jgi:purine-nucleoside phosphorylase
MAATKHNNTDDLLKQIYNIDSNEKLDLIVIAPSWLPEKIMKNYDVKISTLSRHSYFGSYLVEYKEKRIAWIQCASGANNIIDTILTLGKSITAKVIFIGAVGALKADIQLGELVTPNFSLAFEGGSLYTYNQIDISNFGNKVTPNKAFLNEVINLAREKQIDLKVKSVYCTDSIICEYMHLDYIKSFNCDLIEMETAAFYRSLELIGKKGIALLVVSDNSTSGVSLIARTEEQNKTFHRARETYIPELILGLCD